jgi:hypothetical protein
MLSSLPIANRGAIACRTIRGARRYALGLSVLILLGWATPDAAAGGDRAKIGQVIRAIIEAEDAKDRGGVLGNVWPDGYFAVKRWNQPRSAFERKPWSQVGFGGVGVNDHSTIVRMDIAEKGNRAVASVRQDARRDYADEFSGLSYRMTNQVILERRRGRWGVLRWERSVREFGSDAAWHRRHP